jgi:hypothetical protein
MDKPKPKKLRQPPLKINLSFDEAMKKIVKAKHVIEKNKKR